jgi:WhiB family transcriptional regulator, redox-sensing transcriptional regulator
MARARCRDKDRALFFPSVGSSGTKARAICANCLVRQECLEYAAADAEIAGIWGGTTDRERRKLRAGRGVGQLAESGVDGGDPSERAAAVRAVQAFVRASKGRKHAHRAEECELAPIPVKELEHEGVEFVIDIERH